MKYVFTKHVIHDGKRFEPGNECPNSMVVLMDKLGAVKPWIVEAPTQPESEKPKAVKK